MHFKMQLDLANFEASTTPIFKQHQICFMAYRATRLNLHVALTLMDPAVSPVCPLSDATHPFIQLNVLLYNSN